MAKKRGKRRKLYGAALAAHQKKRTRSKSRSRKNPAPKSYKRKGRRVRAHFVKRYRRPRANPFRLPSLGQAGSIGQEALMAFAVLGGTFAVSAWLSGQASRFSPLGNQAWARWLTKIAVAAGAAYGVQWFVKNPKYRAAIWGAAALPLGVEAVAGFAPGIASRMLPQIAYAPAASAGVSEEFAAELGLMPSRNKFSDNTIAADLEAELEQDNESGMF